MNREKDIAATRIEEALAELDTYLKDLGPCGDGYCVIRKPKGMHTNGGCRCSGDRYKMQRFAYAHNRFEDAVKKALGE